MNNNRLPIIALLVLLARPAIAETPVKWLNQTVYAPVYSHIYAEDRYKDKPFLLTATLSVRNTDTIRLIILKSVNYYDSEGSLLTRYLDAPVTIPPMGSSWYIVPASEAKGGVGAKFLIEWESPQAVAEPIIESVMIGTKLQQGISFLSVGRVIKGTPAKEP